MPVLKVPFCCFFCVRTLVGARNGTSEGSQICFRGLATCFLSPRGFVRERSRCPFFFVSCWLMVDIYALFLYAVVEYYIIGGIRIFSIFCIYILLTVAGL